MPRPNQQFKEEAMKSLAQIIGEHPKHANSRVTLAKMDWWCKKYRGPMTYHKIKKPLFGGLL